MTDPTRPDPTGNRIVGGHYEPDAEPRRTVMIGISKPTLEAVVGESFRRGWLLGFVVGAIIAAIVSALLVNTWSTPRSAPATTPRPSAVSHVAPGGGGAKLAQASTSPGPTEAPTAQAAPRTRGAEPATKLDPAPQAAAGASHLRTGKAAFAWPSFGAGYLAIPEGPGITVRVCLAAVPARCILRVSTDAGPERALQRAGRVADLSYVDFGHLCRCTPEVVGLIRVVIHYGPALPATDTRP